ncbi:hypothetical protein [Halobacillus salinus]|uniref:Uncharacterized protein n=1 Tax=Halobacillus salinus TaxID=192814 RepID=A0A4Z0H0D6_9BACI|nr:hypothetical protein [Halobacillus salinus]TGB03580.1 hypothetical protein E4663_00820 [Halobacillus salinus]
MEDFYSSTLKNLEKTFMPHLSEYQQFIDFETMRKMKQVAKDKRPVYFDLHIEEIVELKTRTIIDLYWDGILMSATIPSKKPFHTTIEILSKPPEKFIARLDWFEKRKAFLPSYLKEEFARRKGLEDTLCQFSMKLFTYLNTYIDYEERPLKKEGTADVPDKAVLPERFQDWDFTFLEKHPGLKKRWLDLVQRTARQYERIEELEIEEKFALETMVDKDVPSFIESFQKLSDKNKELKKDDLLETIRHLRLFIEDLERKEEENHSYSFDKKRVFISSKYNKTD